MVKIRISVMHISTVMNNSIAVLQYCVASPLKHALKDPQQDLYNWFLMTFNCELDMENLISE